MTTDRRKLSRNTLWLGNKVWRPGLWRDLQWREGWPNYSPSWYAGEKQTGATNILFRLCQFSSSWHVLMLIKVSHKSHQRAAAQHSARSTKVGSEPVPVRKGTKISSRFCRTCANPFFSRSASLLRLGVVVFAQALKIDLFTTIESACYEHCTALHSAVSAWWRGYGFVSRFFGLFCMLAAWCTAMQWCNVVFFYIRAKRWTASTLEYIQRWHDSARVPTWTSMPNNSATCIGYPLCTVSIYAYDVPPFLSGSSVNFSMILGNFPW